MTNRTTYIEKMKLQLDALNAKMNALQGKAHVAKQDARAKYQEEMNKLRQQSQLAIDKLDELKASSEDGWDGVVLEMEKMRDAFTHSFHYFRSQL
jgi:predicted  nucleic acid-binding Zn-ribbon protein